MTPSVLPDVQKLADETTARYSQAAGGLAGQVASMRKGLAGVYAKLTLLKRRLHDEIANEDDPAEELHEAYVVCCTRLGRIQQAMGNLEGIANRVS